VARVHRRSSTNFHNHEFNRVVIDAHKSKEVFVMSFCCIIVSAAAVIRNNLRATFQNSVPKICREFFY